MGEVQAKIIVDLIGLLATILGIIAILGGFYAKVKKQKIEDAKREQYQTDQFDKLFSEMNAIKKRLDIHNNYAEKIGGIEISLAGIKKDIEYIRKENK